MGRAAKYTDRDILDAALEIVAEDGAHAATAAAIAKRIGAPSGSVYHRFSSRDLILATLWIRAVQRFQRGFLESLDCPEPQAAAERAVLHTLRWAAEHRKEAMVLTMYRRSDLIALWPEELGDALRTLNDDVQRSILRFTVAHFGTADAEALGRARFALIDLPYSAVRHALRAEEPPWMAAALITASMSVLGSGAAAS